MTQLDAAGEAKVDGRLTAARADEAVLLADYGDDAQIPRPQGRPRPSVRASRRWRIRNWFRQLWTGEHFIPLVRKVATQLRGVQVVVGELRATLTRADGVRVDYGLLGRHVVTTTGKGFIVDAWQNSLELEIMKYHGVGTGTTAAAAGDTALQTESTTILTVDSTRATGSLTEASATVFRTVGTQSFDGAGAITEWGLLSQAATGGGVLFDHQVFSAINVVSGDSVTFTYDLTVS